MFLRHTARREFDHCIFYVLGKVGGFRANGHLTGSDRGRLADGQEPGPKTVPAGVCKKRTNTPQIMAKPSRRTCHDVGIKASAPRGRPTRALWGHTCCKFWRPPDFIGEKRECRRGSERVQVPGKYPAKCEFLGRNFVSTSKSRRRGRRRGSVGRSMCALEEKQWSCARR